MNDGSLSFRFGPISPAAEGPLYEQIVAAVKREVAAGRIDPNVSLPSVRALALVDHPVALQLLVGPLHRDHAHQKVRRQGLGAFLAPAGAERLREEKAQAARDGLKAAIAAGRQAGLSDRELQDLFKSELSEKTP